jgi:hypothetical protein
MNRMGGLSIAALTLLLSSMLPACGGEGAAGGTVDAGGIGDSGGVGDSGGGPDGGSTGSEVSKGAITATGSVFVNGIEFSTSGAAITIDDTPGTEDNLKVGMVVKVRGTIDDATKTGTATHVEARDLLEGTIDDNGVDPVNKTITVMGQTVRVEDNVTRLNDDDAVKVFAAAGFAAGQRVEVHGFADDNGGLRASRVARKASGEIEIKGFVASIGSGSFVLSLTPGGSPALTVTGTLPTGAIVGSLVEVKASAAPVAGAITAISVQLEDALGAAGEKVEVEGIVTSGTVDSFLINGQRVLTTAATLFEGGLKADFAVGAKLEAEGPLDANAAIVATKVSFRSNIKIEADVTAFAAGSSLAVLGRTVAIDQFTRIDNGPLAVGQHVEVRANPDRDGNLIATRIVVRNPDTRAFLQGPVSAASSGAGTLSILGTTINTNAQTEFRISSDSSEPAVTAAAFFAQVNVNVTVVKVRWRPFTGSTAAAVDEVEIELGK